MDGAAGASMDGFTAFPKMDDARIACRVSFCSLFFFPFLVNV
jgi:hypothetical protein